MRRLIVVLLCAISAGSLSAQRAPKPTLVYLVRHGETDGGSPSHLSDIG
jgi:hypothetical protein